MSRDAHLVHVHAIDFFFDYLAWTKPWTVASWSCRRMAWASSTLNLRRTSQARLVPDDHTAFAASLCSIAAVSASDFERFGPIRARGYWFVSRTARMYRPSTRCLGNRPNYRNQSFRSGDLPGTSASTGWSSSLPPLRRYDLDWRLTIAGEDQAICEPSEIRALVAEAGLRDAVEVVVASPT